MEDSVDGRGWGEGVLIKGEKVARFICGGQLSKEETWQMAGRTGM